jgi:quinoprotein glucose dehydrogenase
MRSAILGLFAFAVFGFQTPPDGDWPVYGRDPGDQRFSPLAQINRENVGRLKVAWTFHTGDAYQPRYDRPTAFEATPIYVEGTLYLATPLGRAIALDPVTGKQHWDYDAKVPRDKGYGDFATRGVSFWKSGLERRIFMATIDARCCYRQAHGRFRRQRCCGSPPGPAHSSPA